MAVGQKDSNGIWQYGEDDLRALFSDLLNLLAGSVSVAIGAIKSRLETLETKTSHLTDSAFVKVGSVGNPPFGTGWTAVPTSGWDGLAYRKRDGILYINGAISKTSWAELDVIFTLPAGFRPTRQTRIYGFGTSMHVIDIFIDGTVRMKTAGGGSIALAGVIPI